jgi:hypothetical protein
MIDGERAMAECVLMGMTFDLRVRKPGHWTAYEALVSINDAPLAAWDSYDQAWVTFSTARKGGYDIPLLINALRHLLGNGEQYQTTRIRKGGQRRRYAEPVRE